MAERVPFFTLFESFQAPRQLRLLLHDACIILRQRRSEPRLRERDLHGDARRRGA